MSLPIGQKMSHVLMESKNVSGLGEGMMLITVEFLNLGNCFLSPPTSDTPAGANIPGLQSLFSTEFKDVYELSVSC